MGTMAAATAALAAAHPASSAPTGPGAATAASEGSCNWVGQVILVGFFYPPVGTVEASGQALSTSRYRGLYSVIGHRFGGSGSTFRVPDLIQKAPDGLRYVICAAGPYPPRSGGGNTCNAQGQVVLVAFPYATANTVTANGQLLSIHTYPQLHQLVGNRFGGSASRGTFGVPNLTHRAPPGLRYLLCTRGTYPVYSLYPRGWCNWLGQIPLYAFNPVQNGFQQLTAELPADGEALSVNQYEALFTLFNWQFGNDFSFTSFDVPDLRRSTPAHLHYQACAQGLYPERAY